MPNRSLRCGGLRPSGPPAEPCGKDLIAREIASADIEIGSSGTSTSSGIDERVWGVEGAWPGGQRRWRNSYRQPYHPKKPNGLLL